jgi:hypothetical protein
MHCEIQLTRNAFLKKALGLGHTSSDYQGKSFVLSIWTVFVCEWGVCAIAFQFKNGRMSFCQDMVMPERYAATGGGRSPLSRSVSDRQVVKGTLACG